METLPVEIVQYIFALACTDGGYTGCALSLVSREVNALSRAARFCSIYLIAYPIRVQSFISLYVRECDKDTTNKPKIKHLYLAIPLSPGNGTPALLPPDDGPNSSHWPPLVPRNLGSTPIIRTRGLTFSSAATKLMRLVAPQLETLVLQGGLHDRPDVSSGFMFSMFDTPFPRLREVTAIRFASIDALLLPYALSASNPLFPAATHLRLIHNGATRPDAPSWLQSWLIHAPRATHLHATCCRGHNDVFASALTDGLGIALREGLPPPDRAGYLTLRYVTFQPNMTRAEIWSSSMGGLDPEHHFTVMKFREHFQNACAERGIKAVVAHPCGMTFGDWGDRLRDEWMDCAPGGVGGLEDEEAEAGGQVGLDWH